MQIASSAIWTCMELASISEYTATVRMFSSLHARMMRTAISPRLATKTFSNMIFKSGRATGDGKHEELASSCHRPPDPVHLIWTNLEQRLAEFHRLAVFDQHLGDNAFDLGLDLVHDFHRFDDADDAIRTDLGADFHIMGGFGRRRTIKSSDHWRFDVQFTGVRHRRRGGRWQRRGHRHHRHRCWHCRHHRHRIFTWTGRDTAVKTAL